VRVSTTATTIPTGKNLERAGISSLSLVYSLIAVQAVLNLFLAYKLNIWLDESFTFYTTGRGITHAFNEALRFELQPPLYFVLLSLWRKLNDSVFFARLPSVIFIAVSIKVVADLSKRFVKEVGPEWLIACLTTSPFLVWAATEIRLYALVILISALLLRFFYDGYLEDSPQTRSRVWYLFIAIAALYTQYYLGFLLLANAVALLVLRRWRALAVYVGSMAVVAICFAPMVIPIIHQASSQIPVGQAPSTVEAVGTMYWRAQEYIMPVGWGQLYFFRRWLVRLGIVVLAFLVIFKYRHSLKPQTIALWTLTATLMFLFLVLLRVTADEVVDGRHTAALFVPLVLSVFSLVTTVARKIIVPWTVLVCFFGTSAIYAAYRPLAKYGDWIRVSSYISSAESDSQPILVFRGPSALPLAHHYKGRNKLVPIPVPYTFEKSGAYYPNKAAGVTELQIANAIAPVSTNAEVWLVTDWKSGFSGEDIDDRVLKEFIDQNYNIESRRIFYNSKVFLLRKKTP
jgi:hypothetical protein